ncbi:MAG: hypothetical protein K8J09_02590 [Planctomycetes bacterium]|nr:hypothetical protein [Planctomycetota bacterium]MCC7397290.1 hypothetical protein [Planctomycetota bacterium]
MTGSPCIVDAPQQTPGQWAVRWFGIVFVALLLGSVPVFHLVWHVALGHEDPPLRTRSQVTMPAATTTNVLDGTWMKDAERSLREASPVVWWLRAWWNELRYRASVPECAQVHFGQREWFFLQQTVTPDTARFVANAETRRRTFAAVRDLVHAAGAELFVQIIPDKVRVYPELAFADGVLPAAVADNYRRVLDELRAEGIHTVDFAAVMAGARAADATSELYYRRDTHWRPAGALAYGAAAAAAIEQHFGSRLSARQPMELGEALEVRALGDLVANQGLASVELPRDDGNGFRTTAMSLLTDHLGELRQYYGVKQRTAAGTVPMTGADPDAEILVIGTSFAEENGSNALALCLGRPVRTVIERGAAGILSLQKAKVELQRGTKAKVVVWEIIERGLFDPPWYPPRW